MAVLLGVGMLLVCLGIIGLIYGIMQKMKAGRVSDAPLVTTGDAASKGESVAGPKGAISVQGRVVCTQPLTAPVSGTPCLWYEVKCEAQWKDGDQTKTKELDHTKVAAEFSVDDGSGPVAIKAQEGGDFEPTQERSQTQSPGLVGGITGQSLNFGSYVVQTGMLAMGTKYTVTEKFMPVQEQLYVCGKAAPGSITPPGWRSMLMSNKSRDAMLADAQGGAKMFMGGGAAAFVLGSILAIVGQSFGGDAAKADVAAAASAANKGAAAKPAAAPPAAPAKKK